MRDDYKKTLIICNHYPIPENIGTNIRTMNFVRFFKEYGPVDIAYSNALPEGKSLKGKTIFSNEYFMKKENIDNFYQRIIRWTKIKDRPLGISKYDNSSERHLSSLIESSDYNYILTRYVSNTWFLFKLPPKYRARVIVDFDDILSGSLYESTLSTAKGQLRRLRLRLNRKFLISYEKKCLTFGASLFCSENDRKKMCQGIEDNIFVVPNIYHDQSFEAYDFEDGFKNNHNLLFVGGLMYSPNIDGLKWFIESIFPAFRAKYESAKLMVVGRSPAPEIQHLCNRTPGVELYGDVPDLKEYYKKCRAVVVPILSGGGTRIKILEAALANRPILSTKIGAEGLDLKDNVDILLFETDYDFLNKYASLLTKDYYYSLTQNARHFVLNKYSYQNFNDVMKKVTMFIDSKKTL